MQDCRLGAGARGLFENVQTRGNAVGRANAQLCAATDDRDSSGRSTTSSGFAPDSDFTSMQFLGLSST